MRIRLRDNPQTKQHHIQKVTRTQIKAKAAVTDEEGGVVDNQQAERVSAMCPGPA